MNQPTVMVEFYDRDRDALITGVEANAAPRAGEGVSIRGETWWVTSVSWAVDYADDLHRRRLRACVNLTREGGE